MARNRAQRGTNVGGQSRFAQIPSANIPRSVFNRSCGLKTTFDAGYLIPIFQDEALPGDTMNMAMTGFCRFATPLHPILDTMKMDVHFFAIPIRLIWDNWQKFMGEQENPGDSTDYEVPQLTTNGLGWPSNSLGDYMGFPVAVPNQSYSALHLRAFNLTFNEWYRDENLQNSAPVPKDDGPDLFTNYTMRRRGKRHDYFTSGLPWPQKGPAVNLPLGSTAPVTGDGTGIVLDTIGAGLGPTNWEGVAGAGGNTVTPNWAAGVNERIDLVSGLQADLSNATAATINEIREAFQIQRMYERDARGGTRYTEILRSHFGVVSPDARLQRPEFLGGGTMTINIVPIPQTSETATTPQGNLAAYGVAAQSFPRWVKSFTEHCVILGIASVRADLNYQQRVDRMYSRKSRFDFYWPSLAHLGEQPILSKEIYSDGTANDEDVFAYQERFAEYRYKASQVTGLMRSKLSAGETSLDTWHLAQDFDAQLGGRPLLNATFIEENPPIDRVIAVQNEPHFLFDAAFNYRCARPMPTYGVPGLVDHF